MSEYTGNIKETGVWLSGFYGSGKSYFGKMLGYIIDNKVINGTPARDRFLPRLEGIKNQSLIENDVRRLDTKNSKVVFLDVVYFHGYGAISNSFCVLGEWHMKFAKSISSRLVCCPPATRRRHCNTCMSKSARANAPARTGIRKRWENI